jgi:hypothetical protein
MFLCNMGTTAVKKPDEGKHEENNIKEECYPG